MNRVQLAVFPALLVSITTIFVITNLIASPQQVVRAAAHSDPQPAAVPAADAGQPEIFQPDGSSDEISNPGDPADEAGPVEVDKPAAECSLSALYPDSVRRWCSLIDRYAAENGLEPGLVAALITQESGGDENAYSSSGAVGLMQVMPHDGLAASFMCPNGPCFASRPSTQELLDPEYNIAFGTQMLADLLSRYGSLRDALKHYGPINVGYYYADLVLGIFTSKS